MRIFPARHAHFPDSCCEHIVPTPPVSAPVQPSRLLRPRASSQTVPPRIRQLLRLCSSPNAAEIVRQHTMTHTDPVFLTSLNLQRRRTRLLALRPPLSLLVALPRLPLRPPVAPSLALSTTKFPSSTLPSQLRPLLWEAPSSSKTAYLIILSLSISYPPACLHSRCSVHGQLIG